MMMATGAGISVWIVVLPFLAAVMCFAAGGRWGARICLGAALSITVLTFRLAALLFQAGPFRYEIGGWAKPLGIGWYGDGLSALMLMVTAAVGTCISFYAVGYLNNGRNPLGKSTALSMTKQTYFWPLWLFVWGGLNVLFLAADAFNIYVALEIVSFSAITLVALSGSVNALLAATRYFFLTIVGSLVYLLGVGFLYSMYSVLDLELLAGFIRPGLVTSICLTLMTLGLIIKSALFPMHFWLPSAHANAPAPVSAILSGFVVMGSYYLLIRLWLETFANAVSPIAAQLLGVLGAIAIVGGAVLALRQSRLKMMLAYSTVSQVGYMFLLFPLYVGTGAAAGFAWNGGIYLAVSHACAKSAAFMVAGTVIYSLGHDRVKDLRGLAQRFPLGAFTFALAGVSLIGLPPSGGFVGKWMLLKAAMLSGQWIYVIIIMAGSILSAIYIFRILELFLQKPADDLARLRAPHWMQISALVVAMSAVVLGLVAKIPLDLLRIDDHVLLSTVKGFFL